MRTALATAAFAAAMAAASPAGGERLSLDLIVSGKTHAPGAKIDVTLRLRNVGKTPVRLIFLNSQRFDITLKDPSGREIWRWSRGKGGLPVVGQETLKPGTEGRRYEVTVPAPEQPGRYVLRAWITSDPPPEASVEIEVR